MGPAPALLFLALQVSAPEFGAVAPVGTPGLNEPRAAALLANDAAPGGTIVSDSRHATPPTDAPDAAAALRRRRLDAAGARLGTGLAPRRSPDDRKQPIIGPIAILAGFGTVIIDVEVPR